MTLAVGNLSAFPASMEDRREVWTGLPAPSPSSDSVGGLVGVDTAMTYARSKKTHRNSHCLTALLTAHHVMPTKRLPDRRSYEYAFDRKHWK
jgi:hypothetical protein